MLKLFAVILGGRADRCNIELHDLVFVVGETLEETHPQLRNKWFGNKKRLHIDSTIELNFVDNHEVVICREQNVKQDKKLFCVNFGGYKSDYFGERHEFGFYVAKSKTEALARAKQDLCVAHMEPHCDDNLVVDDIIAVDDVDQFYIELIPTANSPTKLQIESVYRRLDLPN